MDENSDIVRDFLVESYENLDQLDRDLVSLEQAPTSGELLSSIFRTIHTIKGTCGFLGFGTLERVTHVGENLLSRMRDGELTLRPDITTSLLSLVDAIRVMLDSIEVQGHEGEADYAELVETLAALQSTSLAGDVPDLSSTDSGTQVELDPVSVASAEQSAPSVTASEPTPVAASLTSNAESAPRLDRCATPGTTASDNSADGRTSSVSDSTIRVDVGLLDKLMNQVGELVLARNQVLQFTGTFADSSFQSTSQRLNLITTELQEGVMKTRMQPIGNIWSKFPRVVRDLAMQCGKQVRINMEGRETELDKTIVEAIKDPLTHLIRNAVDHGIESPEQRLASGKPAEGLLTLRAFHEGGQVNIEIADNGAGLHLDRVRQKAVERGLMTSEQAARLNDRDAAQLIFAPGFSTAAKVTNVSGRGVGMDVVRTNVERIGGTVDVLSEPGHGTTVKLKIPLTLAIIPALVVTCQGDRYAIPQVNLLELVRLEGEQAAKGIESIHGAPVHRLRGQLLPIVYLDRELRLEGAAAARLNSGSTGSSSPLEAAIHDTAASPAAGDQQTPQDAEARDVVNIVVLRADDRQFGLVVDSINDTEEIVVKPLSKQLKGIPVYAGATIMGDGQVALILDVLGIAQQARVVSAVRDRGVADQRSHSAESNHDLQTLLIFTVGQRRMALPISMVARLEEIVPSRVERADCRQMVQYRGQILPLVPLAELLGVPNVPGSSAQPATTTEPRDERQPLQVIVYSSEGHSLGLVVDQILDIVDTAVDIQLSARGCGLLATAVIQQRVTELLDLPAIIRSTAPQFLGATDAQEHAA